MPFRLIAAAFLAIPPAAGAPLTVPDAEPGERRVVTVDDVAGLRKAGSLSVSPDGSRYALFLTQGDPAANAYRTGWFVGRVEGGALTRVGDGGHVRYATRASGGITGEIEAREARWSPDGRWIAYLARRNGEIQLWRSRVNGSRQEQLTRNVSDVRDFAWSEDGRLLYFTAGTPRAELKAAEEDRARRGYRYDHDLFSIGDLLTVERPIKPETELATWVVIPGSRKERVASEAEKSDFARTRSRDAAGRENIFNFIQNAAVPPVAHPSGGLAWLERSRSGSMLLRVTAALSAEAEPIPCEAEACLGLIRSVWWSADGAEVYFWGREGLNHAGFGFYAWSPATGEIRAVLRTLEDVFRHCAPASSDRLVCVRETKLRPEHVVALDLRSHALEELADLNPEFRNIRLGRVERIEWDTPEFAWSAPGGELEGVYTKRSHGYILYPPDFDPREKYPVFIDPYAAGGFNSSVGGEHALHVYAANGFVVPDTAFPQFDRHVDLDLPTIYSAELDFPHLSMLSESTLRALDLVAGRGFIDTTRTGIGGVSHGTFVPIYLMQKHDRIAAISISSPASWAGEEYYWGTALFDKVLMPAQVGAAAYREWKPRPEGAGAEYWNRLDITRHLDTLEAPVLMHLPAREVDGRTLRLTRYLRDDGIPYDAYVFRDETHLKWQPAHLYHIMHRNLDWFRFWLQDIDDPSPGKVEQYERWRELRKLQCKNPRSLRDYCGLDGESG